MRRTQPADADATQPTGGGQADRGDGSIEGSNAGLGLRQQLSPGRRQHHLAAVALKQADTQPLLELGNAL